MSSFTIVNICNKLLNSCLGTRSERIPGNETADILVREGATSTMIGPEAGIEDLTSFYRAVIRLSETLALKKHCDSLTTARQSRNCIEIRNKNSKFFISLGRNNIQRIARVLTRHCK